MKAKTFLKYLILLVVAGNLALAAVVFLGGGSQKSPPSPTPLPAPNPNGYDDFVKAGQAVRNNPGDYLRLPEADLRALLATNAEALRLARLGLSHDCLVPQDYSPEYLPRILHDFAPFRNVAFLFCADGKLAELEHRTNDAAKICLDGMRFGQQCSRGGVMCAKLTGMSGEADCLDQLRHLSSSLDAPACRQVIASIQALDLHEEPAEQFILRDHAWLVKSATSWLQARQIRKIIEDPPATAQRNERDFINRHHSCVLRRRQAMVLFATHACQLEKGTPPTNFGDLVPAYLTAIPQDPETETNLVWGKPFKEIPSQGIYFY